ncbi:treacle protein-like [Phoenix dactylifera]|uniref:Treacle protein-like n=1 Tax=Phoenix dactylifera TaxID=42345 RepID=A0A8B7MUP8_PHODC|nr:treacle protein-like [Phoenix dactylifera]
MMKSAAAGKGMMVGSSPGRAEKLPAPGLARLLGGGGRSRGRSGVARTSPMFGTRSRSVGRQAGAEARAGEEGEPSSPKVTCIGQVRIRNKNKKKSDTRTFKSRERLPTAAKRCPCPQRSLLCCVFVCRQKGSGGQPWWSLWWRQRWSSLRSGKSGRYQQRKSKIERNEVDLMKPPIEMVGGGGGGGGGRGGGYFESDREGYRDDDEDEEEMENEEEEETRVFVSSATTTPPKNALLLMRCRSAPHNRSSSLAANRFPVSPLPPSESGSSPVEKEAGKKIEEREEEEEEGGRSSNGSSRDGEEGSRPLVLTRCKSEPARKVAVRDASYCFRANNDGGGGGDDGGGRQRRLALVHEERPPPPLSPPR